MSKVYSPIVMQLHGKAFRLVRETFANGETLEYPDVLHVEITVEELREARPYHPLLRHPLDIDATPIGRAPVRRKLFPYPNQDRKSP